MSMILEALRRADRERQGPASTPPNLATIHFPPIAPEKRKHTRLIRGLLLVLAGTGLGMAVTYWQWGSAGPASRMQPTPSGELKALEAASIRGYQPEQSATEAEPTTDQSPEPEPVNAEPAPEIAQLYRSEPSSQTPEIHRLYNPPTPEPEPEPEPVVSRELPEQPRPQAEPEPQPEPRPEPQSEQQPEPLPSQNIHGALSIRALPSSVQQAIPSIYYQSHHYQEGQDSYVVLNQQEYRPGDQVVSEVILEQIAKDGIVLSFRDQQFRLARLSSWVNL